MIQPVGSCMKAFRARGVSTRSHSRCLAICACVTQVGFCVCDCRRRHLLPLHPGLPIAHRSVAPLVFASCQLPLYACVCVFVPASVASSRRVPARYWRDGERHAGVATQVRQVVALHRPPLSCRSAIGAFPGLTQKPRQAIPEQHLCSWSHDDGVHGEAGFGRENKLHQVTEQAARHTLRTVPPGELGDLRSCPTVSEAFSESCRKVAARAELRPQYRPNSAVLGHNLGRLRPHLVNIRPNLFDLAQRLVDLAKCRQI